MLYYQKYEPVFKGGTFTHGGKRNILYYYTDLLS